jgi:hypothetical protein
MQGIEPVFEERAIPPSQIHLHLPSPLPIPFPGLPDPFWGLRQNADPIALNPEPD